MRSYGPGPYAFNDNPIFPKKGEWEYLGRAELAGSAVTVGPIIWSGIYRFLKIKYLVVGASANCIPRLLLGSAAISTTALTNSNKTQSDAVAVVSMNSIPGVPLYNVNATNVRRGGICWVQGDSGSFKEISVIGHNGVASVSAAPLAYKLEGFFSDLGTNLPIQRIQMSVYDLINSTALSTVTFNAGSYIAAWGLQD